MVGIGVCVAPLLGLLAPAFEADRAILSLASRYLADSLIVIGGAGGLAILIGVGAAWAIAMTEFPLRRWFGAMMILPLALPGYVAAYVWADVLAPSGPIRGLVLQIAPQSTILQVSGPTGPWAVGIVLGLVLYPYVYLPARAAFEAQAANSLEAARSLGASPWAAFALVGAPMALPAILAGAALVMMEAAADYGASVHLGAQTLSVGLFRAWFGAGDVAIGAKIGLCLAGLAGLLLWIEVIARRRADRLGFSRNERPAARYKLSNTAAFLTICMLFVCLFMSFLAPVGRLLYLAISYRIDFSELFFLSSNTFALGATGAALCILLALCFIFGAQAGANIARWGAPIAGLAYAMPGAVLGLGASLALAGLGASSLGAIGFLALFWAYAARFTQTGLGPMRAALARAGQGYSASAASLGAKPLRRFFQIEGRFFLPGALIGALFAFIEIAKELPATFALRPFGFDSLAVRIHNYAADERLGQAAAPALALVLLSLAPAFWVARQIERDRS